MPHLGHLPGLSETTSGCIGQVDFATACVVAGTLAGVKRGAEGAAFSPGWVIGIECCPGAPGSCIMPCCMCCIPLIGAIELSEGAVVGDCLMVSVCDGSGGGDSGAFGLAG